MYNNNTDKDLVSAGLITALGAGVVTSFSVGQGQSPLTALIITLFAALCGIICHKFGII